MYSKVCEGEIRAVTTEAGYVLHHEGELLTLAGLSFLLNQAYESGRNSKIYEIKQVLKIK